jgi:holo-[acyl-carrier protein] synthase
MFPHRLAWHKAEVLTLPGRRKPVLVIHTSSPKADSHENEDRDHQQLRRQAAQHSISHDGDYATANVLAVNCFSVFSAIETLEDREEV